MRLPPATITSGFRLSRNPPPGPATVEVVTWPAGVDARGPALDPAQRIVCR